MRAITLTATFLWVLVISSITFMSYFIYLNLASGVKQDGPIFISGKRNKVHLYTAASSIDTILQEIQDTKLREAFQKYKTISDVAKSPIKYGNLKKIIVVSTWRSGSTYLAEILNSVPGTFYHYEPFYHYQLIDIDDVLTKHQISQNIDELLSCNFDNKEKYFTYAKQRPIMFSRNKRMWNICSQSPDMCYVPKNCEQMCRIFPIQLMKTVRAKLSNLKPLLTKDSNTQVIWLVRDPRAIIHSRMTNAPWCKGDYCRQPKFLCKDMIENLNEYNKLKTLHPSQIYRLYYETLDQSPTETVKELFQFLKLPVSPEIYAYIKEHTSKNVDSPSETYRKIGERYQRWKSELPWSVTVQTQNFCRDIMENLGYKIAKTREDIF